MNGSRAWPNGCAFLALTLVGACGLLSRSASAALTVKADELRPGYFLVGMTAESGADTPVIVELAPDGGALAGIYRSPDPNGFELCQALRKAGLASRPGPVIVTVKRGPATSRLRLTYDGLTCLTATGGASSPASDDPGSGGAAGTGAPRASDGAAGGLKTVPALDPASIPSLAPPRPAAAMNAPGGAGNASGAPAPLPASAAPQRRLEGNQRGLSYANFTGYDVQLVSGAGTAADSYRISMLFRQPVDVGGLKTATIQRGVAGLTGSQSLVSSPVSLPLEPTLGATTPNVTIILPREKAKDFLRPEELVSLEVELGGVVFRGRSLVRGAP